MTSLEASLTGVFTSYQAVKLAELFESGSASNVRTYDSITDISALTGPDYPDLVFLNGYDAAYPGVGAGFWRWDATSTYTPNRAVIAPGGIATGRYFPIFYNSRIDVTRFGARDGTTNDGAVQDALAMQQDPTIPGDKVLFFPGGRYVITSTISNVADEYKLHIEGIGRWTGNGNPPQAASSIIEMATNNIPIVELTGFQSTVRSVSFKYTTAQTSSNTNGIAIALVTGGVNTGKLILEDLDFDLVYSAISAAPLSSAYTTNSSIRDIHVNRFTGTAIRLSSGTTWQCSDIYIQNQSASTLTVTNIVKAGTQITLTTSSALTALFTVNTMVLLNNVDSTYNGYYFIKSTAANTIVLDFAVDPGVPPTVTTGTISTIAGETAGPAIYLEPAFEGSFTGIDIEIVATANGTILECWGAQVTFDNLHIEFCFSTNTVWRPIKHSSGNLSINALSIINSGAPSGGTANFIFKNNVAGATFIGQVLARDLGSTGVTYNFASVSPTTLSYVRIDQFYPQTTVRANATSIITGFGESVQRLNNSSVRMIGSESLTASSGTEIGISQALTVNQSGTAGYSGWRFTVTETATGSGTKRPWQMFVGATEIASVSNVGVLALLSSVSCQPGAASTATTNFGRVGTTDSYVQIGAYGQDAGDLRLNISPNSIQSLQNSGTAGRTLSINSSATNNSNVRIGPGTAGVGLRIGGTATTVVSKMNFGVSGAMVAGVVVVPLTDVTANTRIWVNRATSAGTVGTYDTATRTPGVDFTITSSSALDTSTLYWLAFEP